VGDAREGGFDETRGAEDGFGREHGEWPAARDGAVPNVRRRANAVRKKKVIELRAVL